MKKIVFSLFILIGCCTSASLFAQNGNGGQRQQEMHTYLKDSVNLSDALADSVMAINKEFQPKMRDIFMDQSSGADDKQSKMQTLRTNMETRYKSAGLSDDQIQKIRDHQDRMRAQMRSRMSGGGQ